MSADRDAKLAAIIRPAIAAASVGATAADIRSLVADTIARLKATGLLIPPDAIERSERGRVYHDGHPLPLEATRTVWETPWTPEIRTTEGNPT